MYVAAAFQNVAVNAGEKHGGGAVNLVSGITTGDMFTPPHITQLVFQWTKITVKGKS